MATPACPSGSSSPGYDMDERSLKRQRVDTDSENESNYHSMDEFGSPPDEGTRSPAQQTRPRRSSYDSSEADEPGIASGATDELAHTFYRHSKDPRRGSSLIPPSEKEDGELSKGRFSTPSKPSSNDNYEPSMILKGHRKGVSMVKFSPDGNMIASCSADCTIKVWDAESGKYLTTMEGHLAGISTIAWSPDSKTVASGSDDKSIRLWEVRTGKAYPVPLLGHHNYIYSIAFSPKGNMIVSGSYDEAVFLWDVRTATVMRSLPAHSDPVGGVDFIRDGTLIVSCAGDGLIRVWDTATGQCLRTLVHEDNPPVVSVRFSPNGKYVLAWTLDSCIRLWDYIEGRCVKTYQGHINKKFSLGGTFGACGNEAFVISGSEDGTLVIWDVKSKVILQRLEGHIGVALGVDTHPSGNKVVSCGLDRTIRIWSRVVRD